MLDGQLRVLSALCGSIGCTLSQLLKTGHFRRPVYLAESETTHGEPCFSARVSSQPGHWRGRIAVRAESSQLGAGELRAAPPAAGRHVQPEWRCAQDVLAQGRRRELHAAQKSQAAGSF